MFVVTPAPHERQSDVICLYVSESKYNGKPIEKVQVGLVNVKIQL